MTQKRMRTKIHSPKDKSKGLSIGVTHYIRDGAQSIWENGIFQNCFFLIALLQDSPIIDRVFIVNGGPGKPEEAIGFLEDAPAPVIPMKDALAELDVIVELSAQLDGTWSREFKARGGTIIGMHVANDYIIDTERMAYVLEPTLLMVGAPYDEIWTLPAFESTCRDYYRVGFRAPVKTMQHLWSPSIIQKSAAKNARQFCYTPGRASWRLGVFEPNLCTVKTCHLPMVLADVAYRWKPNAIEVLRVFNALALKEHAGFVEFARSLELVKHNKASFEGRYPIFDIMAVECDAIISHHWQNAQNYLYYEALHGGFPLVHNSHLLGDCGYRYADFDPEDGASALLQAIAEHDLNLDEYKRKASEFIDTLNPQAQANISSYTSAIEAAVMRGANPC